MSTRELADNLHHGRYQAWEPEVGLVEQLKEHNWLLPAARRKKENQRNELVESVCGEINVEDCQESQFTAQKPPLVHVNVD